MKTHSKSLAILALGLALLLPPSSITGQKASAADRYLPAKELVSLFPGVFVGVVDGSWKMKIKASKSGTLKGWVMGRTDNGRWRVRKGQFCVVWAKWTKGKESCSRVVRQGKWLQTTDGRNMKFRKI